jgi:hypothetical protein
MASQERQALSILCAHKRIKGSEGHVMPISESDAAANDLKEAKSRFWALMAPVGATTHHFKHHERHLIQQTVNRALARPLLEGSSILIGGVPSIHFRLPDAIDPLTIDVAKLGVMPFGWDGVFGQSLTFTLFTKQHGFLSKAVVYPDDPAFAALKTGKLTGSLVKGTRLCDHFGIDYTSTTEKLSQYNTVYDYVQCTQLVYPDKDAHFWEIQRQLTAQTSLLTAQDHLSIGWIDHFRTAIFQAASELSNVKDFTVPPFDSARVSPAVALLLASFHEQNLQLHSLITRMVAGFDADASYFGRLLKELWPLFSVDEGMPLTGVCDRALLCALASPSITACGRQLTWLDIPSGRIQQTAIEPANFPEGFRPENYWQQLPFVHRFNWGYLIDGKDTPIDLSELTITNGNYPTADNVIEVEASAAALLAEAVSSKKWTIPPRAVIDLTFGPFSYLEVSEIAEEVHFVCRTAEGHFAIIWLDPSANRCSFIGIAHPMQWYLDKSNEQALSVGAAVKLLLAAIVRDFWVVEEREKVFATRRGEQSIRRKDRGDEPCIVYLPRMRYVGHADTQRCESELDHYERRAHFVRPHLRKADHPSDHQLFLAKRFGFEVPVGYTFVRSHERGRNERQVVYRSRSALQSLYTVVDVPSNTASNWFQFERDVYSLMKALGFTVEHVAASRRGDQGIDVYAKKGRDLEEVNWIIQCKCKAPTNKVGPHVIRELIGVLHAYPFGTKGMVITTSAFTKGAKNLASTNAIRLINGEEFVQLVEGQQSGQPLADSEPP